MLALFSVIVLSYIVGSIPSSVWIGKLVKGIDIREHGSGNAGTTNTFRMLGWKPGVVVALMDLGKGFVATHYITQVAPMIGVLPDNLQVGTLLQIFCGIAVVFGHMFPLFAKFKGGKGAITAAGALYGIEPISITCSIVVFLVVLFTTRYVSLGSMLAATSYPVFLLILKHYFGMSIPFNLLSFGVIVALGIDIKHHANIKRLIQGNENRIRSFKPAKGRLNKQESTS